MESERCILKSRRVLLAGGVQPATLVVEDGRFTAIGSFEESPAHALDLGDGVVLPGLVDAHVHVNDPGRSHWEGFATASRAAAAGGVTTLVDMPLNSSPVTTSPAALRAKVQAAAGTSRVDFALWGGLVPGNADEVSALLEAGAVGIKCFLCPSGLDEFPPASAADLHAALPQIASHRSILLAHAEDPGILEQAASPGPADPTSYRAYLATRPPAAEVRAIETLVAAVQVSGASLHVVHVASVQALEVLSQARRRGLPVTAETCPHYLTFEAEEIPDRATAFKCAPPIRDGRHREALWQALSDGVLDLVATDHSPCPPELKAPESGNFFEAWGGIASLELLVPAVWTEARARGFQLEHLVRWLSQAPARLAGLGHRKGAIAVGYDADLVVFQPDRELLVKGEELQHRHAVTPYDGRKLLGVVEKTYLRGHLVFDRGTFPGEPRGRWLRRGLPGEQAQMERAQMERAQMERAQMEQE